MKKIARRTFLRAGFRSLAIPAAALSMPPHITSCLASIAPDAMPYAHIPMLDAHVHVGLDGLYDHLVEGMRLGGCTKLNLLALRGRRNAQNQIVLRYKEKDPERFYIFAAFDFGDINPQDAASMQAKALSDRLANQAHERQAEGFDGFKIIESKPITRRTTPWALDGEVYEGFFCNAEKLGVPLMWHVGDPIDFWNPENINPDAKRKGWTYDQAGDLSREAFRREAENVIARHPGLKVIFAHFYFLGNELDRARKLLEAHPNVYLDTTPASEIYYQFSANLKAARQFFIDFQDRIIFGTDNGTWTLGKQKFWPPRKAAVKYLGFRAFFGTDAAIPKSKLPIQHYDSTGTVLHGLGLSESILEKLFFKNFETVVAKSPCPLPVRS